MTGFRRDHGARSLRHAVQRLSSDPMHPVPRPAFARLLAAMLACVALPAWAAKVADVQVRGLDPVMTDNVRRSLSLVDANGNDAPVSVTVTVQPGMPVRVRNSDVGIDGVGAADVYLDEEIAAFNPRRG